MSSARPLAHSNVAVGVSIGLAILCIAAVLVTAALDRPRETEPELAVVVAELQDARDELRAAAVLLRDANEAMREGTRELGRKDLGRNNTTININDRPLSALGLRPTPPEEPEAPMLARCVAPERCTITRAALDEILSNPASLARQARIIPIIHDGEQRGFKIYGIRPGSLPAQLGFKNGDLLTAANGLPLRSLDHAMATYAKLRRADAVTFELERKGEPLALQVSIE